MQVAIRRLWSLSIEFLQAGAREVYRERAFPDMVLKHKVSTQGRRRTRLAPTVNAEFATKFEKMFLETFGTDGSKLANMDRRCIWLSLCICLICFSIDGASKPMQMHRSHAAALPITDIQNHSAAPLNRHASITVALGGHS